MKFSLLIETEENRYEVFFDIADLAAASERLTVTLAEIDKRYLKKGARPGTSLSRTKSPSPTVIASAPSPSGGAK